MSRAQVQVSRLQLVTESWLEKNTSLPTANRQSLAMLVTKLKERIPADRNTAIGIAGAPGSGKSTLARALVHGLSQLGIPACLLSLDDYYLGRKQREELAENLHPLFRQRGVPGTHELDRLVQDFDRIRRGEIQGLRLPVFDKSTDDRAPEPAWRSLDRVPRLIVLEGWFTGAPPQNEAGLAAPTNELERRGDPDGAWRGEMLRAWQRHYHAFKSRLDQLWYIRVPDWNCVIDWRWRQEMELTERNLQDRAEVETFLACFERVVKHMQNSHSNWADLTLSVDRNHEPGLFETGHYDQSETVS